MQETGQEAGIEVVDVSQLTEAELAGAEGSVLGRAIARVNRTSSRDRTEVHARFLNEARRTA